jgi:chemotaxis protein CheC
MMDNVAHISEEEKDILQEIMNIAFGKAAADLAEVINIFVVLSVPDIKILKAVDLPEYIRTEFSEFGNISIVEQNFWGEFKGNALLIFPAGAGKELISLLGDGGEPAFEPQSSDILENETLMEVGNILIGACVGKIAELLKDVVTYSPPRVIIEDHPDASMQKTLVDPSNSAILLKTVFCFNERDVNGFLFLITSDNSVIWLKKALADFMEQYE